MKSLKELERLQDRMLKERLETVIPACMEETGIDCWLIMCGEYNEDPVFSSLTPASYRNARRISILLFTKTSTGYRKVSFSLPDGELNRYYEQGWIDRSIPQMETLCAYLKDLDPTGIAVNVCPHDAICDGLSHSMYMNLIQHLSAEQKNKLISSEALVVRVLETRTQTEINVYPEAVGIALGIIDKAFSTAVIRPGITTCQDVVDFMKQSVHDIGLQVWFEPTLDLQNEHGMQDGDTLIRPGDLLHCDFGIVYAGICTDTQRLCYVPKENEYELPKELADAMRRNNRLQDLVLANIKEGQTGNDVFVNACAQAKNEGIRPIVYSHPVGRHGHGSGATIGLWSDQNPQYPKGERKVYMDTTYALELSTLEYLDMYKRDTYIFTEETVLLVKDSDPFLAEGRDVISVLR